jgi:hypothetical protein
MIELNVYKNNDETSEQYGKAYARVDYKEQYDVSKLARHMSEHNAPFSEGTILGILTDMVKCIRELTLNGNTVKIENLAIFKASVESNPCSRYGVMRASIGEPTTKVGGVTTETGNAVKSMKLLAQATGEYMREELNKDVVLGWTTKAQELINADKALMAGGSGGTTTNDTNGTNGGGTNTNGTNPTNGGGTNNGGGDNGGGGGNDDAPLDEG